MSVIACFLPRSFTHACARNALSFATTVPGEEDGGGGGGAGERMDVST